MKFNLNESSFLSYLKLKASIMKIISKGTYRGGHEHLDNSLKKLANERGMVSGIYRLLLCPSPSGDIQTKKSWEQDLGISLSSLEWDRIWRKSVSMSKCIRFRVIQFKNTA